MDNTKINMSDYKLSCWQGDVNSTAFVENAIDIVLIINEDEIKY